MNIQQIAQNVAVRYGQLSQVQAVVMAGSQTTGSADSGSDVDLYVYFTTPIPVAARDSIARANAKAAEVDNQYWEWGDEWVEQDSHIKVDVMFRDVRWIEGEIDRVLKHYQASVGYSTAIWYNVRHSQILHDKECWFRQLQQMAQQPYPDALRQAIVAKNYPLLRAAMSSYHAQLTRALAHNDAVSVNHRIAAFLASYFDILLAINRQPHPGEKRLLSYVEAHCTHIPQDMVANIHQLLRAEGQAVLELIDSLVNELDVLLRADDLI